MARYISFILFYSLLSHCFAQRSIFPPLPKTTSNSKIIDFGYIRIWYALNALDINKPETYDELQRLEVGQTFSKYYSHYIFNSDSLVTEWIKKHPTAQSTPIRLGPKGKKTDQWSEYYYSEFFKDFTNNTLTEYARMPMYMYKSNSYSTEEIPVQNWKVENEIREVAGYQCQKAICEFRGRSYTAWFTTEIPINNGPWKFGGLPGLILKVCDNDNLYSFECVKIQKYKQKYSIKIYDYKNYKEISRDKLLKLQRKINENYYEIIGFKPTNGTAIPKSKSYNPLELE